MNRYYSIQFAQTYGSGAYGACTYQSATTCSTSVGGGSSPSSGGGLVNTGFMVLMIVTLACLLIFVALFVRFWRRRKLAPQAAPFKTDETTSARRF